MTDFEISDDVRSFFEDLSKPEPDPVIEVTAENPPVPDENIVNEIEVVTEPAAETPPVETTTEPTATEATETQQEPAPEEEQTEYQKWQSMKDREIADMRKDFEARIEAQNEALRQQYEWNQQVFQQQQQAAIEAQQAREQQQQQQNLHVDPETLDRAMQNDLRQTFAWVASNRPDLVPTVISKVRADVERYPNGMANQVADSMQVEYSRFEAQRAAQTAQEQMEQALAQQAQQFAPSQEEQVTATMEQIVTHLEAKHGESFKALGPEIEAKAAEMGPAFRQYLAQHGQELTPQAIADFMTQIYFDVREQKLQQVASQPRQAVELQPSQHIENPGAAFEQAVTPDDDAINEILKGAEALGIGVTQASV